MITCSDCWVRERALSGKMTDRDIYSLNSFYDKNDLAKIISKEYECVSDFCAEFKKTSKDNGILKMEPK